MKGKVDDVSWSTVKHNMRRLQKSRNQLILGKNNVSFVKKVVQIRKICL